MAKDKDAVKSFVLRIDAATMEALERWAADEFRSTNGQLQWIIHEALQKSGRLKSGKGFAAGCKITDLSGFTDWLSSVICLYLFYED